MSKQAQLMNNPHEWNRPHTLPHSDDSNFWAAWTQLNTFIQLWGRLLLFSWVRFWSFTCPLVSQPGRSRLTLFYQFAHELCILHYTSCNSISEFGLILKWKSHLPWSMYTRNKKHTYQHPSNNCHISERDSNHQVYLSRHLIWLDLQRSLRQGE